MYLSIYREKERDRDTRCKVLALVLLAVLPACGPWTFAAAPRGDGGRSRRVAQGG